MLLSAVHPLRPFPLVQIFLHRCKVFHFFQDVSQGRLFLLKQGVNANPTFQRFLCLSNTNHPDKIQSNVRPLPRRYFHILKQVNLNFSLHEKYSSSFHLTSFHKAVIFVFLPQIHGIQGKYLYPCTVPL